MNESDDLVQWGFNTMVQSYDAYHADDASERPLRNFHTQLPASKKPIVTSESAPAPRGRREPFIQPASSQGTGRRFGAEGTAGAFGVGKVPGPWAATAPQATDSGPERPEVSSVQEGAEEGAGDPAAWAEYYRQCAEYYRQAAETSASGASAPSETDCTEAMRSVAPIASPAVPARLGNSTAAMAVDASSSATASASPSTVPTPFQNASSATVPPSSSAWSALLQSTSPAAVPASLQQGLACAPPVGSVSAAGLRTNVTSGYDLTRSPLTGVGLPAYASGPPNLGQPWSSQTAGISLPSSLSVASGLPGGSLPTLPGLGIVANLPTALPGANLPGAGLLGAGFPGAGFPGAGLPSAGLPCASALGANFPPVPGMGTGAFPAAGLAPPVRPANLGPQMPLEAGLASQASLFGQQQTGQLAAGIATDDDLANLLMAWYYSGYYTGLYAAQQGKK